MEETTRTCRTAAPEDLAEGDYVAVLRIVYDLPSFLWCGDIAVLPPEKPVRFQYTPDDAGTPLRIEQICLPFLFVRSPDGTHRTLDLRRTEVTRVPRKYAETVIDRLTKDAKKKLSVR